MDEGKFTCMMFTIVQTLCDSIKNYFNISYEEAMNLLYHSKLYKALEKEETKMWYYSNYDLFRMFLEENKLTGKEVYELFEKYGALKYLHDGYDILHTQGDRWIMNDINEFLKIRGYNEK